MLLSNDSVQDKKNNYYFFNTFIIYLAFIISIVLLMIVIPKSEYLIGVMFCLFAIFRPVYALQCISLLVIIRFLNPAFGFGTGSLVIFAWILFFITFIKYLSNFIEKNLSLFVSITVFVVTICVFSSIVSEAADISIFKAIAFYVGVVAVLSAIFSIQKKSEYNNLKIWFCALISFVFLFSIPTLLYPEIAYNKNDVGFQGVLNHPQTLGAFLAPPTIWLITRFLFYQKKIITILIPLLSIFIVMIFMTQARTSLVAIVLSLTIIFLFLLFHSRYVSSLKKNNFYIKIIIILTLLFSVISVFPSLQDSVSQFIFKRESKSLDDALSSRSGGIYGQWNNFLKSPLVGHGFGVYPGPVPSGEVVYWMGLPVSAAVEKGFLPTAILEEVGILGLMFFLLFFITLVKNALKNKDFALISVFFSCLFINLGELVFFSTGGIGIFYWCLMGLCVVNYKIKHK